MQKKSQSQTMLASKYPYTTAKLKDAFQNKANFNGIRKV